MKVHIEIDEKKLREILFAYLSEQLGSIQITEQDVRIEVKSKQNYRSEWEKAEFRGVLEKIV